MSQTDVIHKGTLNTTLMKIFDRLSHSDAFMDALVGNIHRHPAQAQDLTKPMSRTTKGKIKDRAENKDKELIDPLPSKTVLSSKAIDDSSIARRSSSRVDKK